jgi:hypothetical protein
MKIQLSELQIKEAIELAAKRHESKGASFRNKNPFSYSKDTKLEKALIDKTHKSHFLGILGEMAYAQLTNKQIDKNIYAVRDKGADVEDVEIKTSTWMGADVELKVKKEDFENKFPNKYVLARIDENNFSIVELIGEITRVNFDKVKREKRYGMSKYGKLLPLNYIVEVKDLKPCQAK